MHRRFKMLRRQDATDSNSVSINPSGASNFRNSNRTIPSIKEDEILCMEMHSIGTSIASESPKQQPTKLKIRTEKSAVILALIVILFLFTHIYRMALKVYEVAMPNTNTIERFKLCFSLKR